MSRFPVLNIIGLMSGTSMDGIDACLARIQFKENDSCVSLDSAEIIATHSSTYSGQLSKKLSQLVNQPEQCHLQTICELNFEVADAFANCALDLMQKVPKTQPIDAIASHGQTVFHIPPGQNAIPSTLQLGDLSVISQKTGIKTIGDFRSADMAQGGHGAPLVPFADQLLFQQTNTHCAVHNLGGISNMTVLPSANSGQAIMAFDTGPANSVINLLMEKYYQTPYDALGKIAQSGNVNQGLLSELIALDYFMQSPPKSTGRELFGFALLEHYFLSGEYSGLSPQDKVATATALTVKSIHHAYQQFVLPKVPVSEVIFGGGGTENAFLMSQLKLVLGPLGMTIKSHADYKIPNQYKEALAFALLGYANLTGVPGNIPSCTGARKAVLLGQMALF